MRIASWLQREWRRLGPWQIALAPLSWVFSFLRAARRACYRAGWLRIERVDVPVVIVGNISVGGTGKTPLTLWLIQRLRERGLSPGVVSRGYGGSSMTGAPREVGRRSNPDEAGDEPVLLALRGDAPVWVGRDRAATVRALLAAHPKCDIVLCDDGLQHYRLARDFEICVIDGTRGFGNGKLLPAGPLREPISRLREVNAVVVNGGRADMLPPSLREHTAVYRMHVGGDALYRMSDAGEPIALASFAAQRVHAVAGIANPSRFFFDLRAAGLQVIEHAFPDHHAFKAADLEFGDSLPVVMTEKDAVKCFRFAREHWFVRPVLAQVDVALANQIVKRVKKGDGSKTA